MDSIKLFSTEPFINALKAFFEELEVPVDYLADEPTSALKILGDKYKPNDKAHCLIEEVYALGMVNDAIFKGTKTFDNLAQVKKLNGDYDGLLIFGVKLKNRADDLPINRSQLAEITRAFNRAFPYTPVTIIFKYNGLISFANSERIKYKQEWREGEKVGKVSVLRDVNIQEPHRGHLEILKELKIPISGKNVVDSFSTLYKHWQEVFSVSILNKKFYNELQNWYFWAIKEVTYPNAPNRLNFETNEKFDEAVKVHKGKNVIRLLTRILFIWFIKEKKLIPEQLFDEKFITSKLIKDFTPQKTKGIFATGKQNSPYYRAILQNLFFATLNQEMGKRAFRGDGKHQNVTNLMRYKSYFKDPEYFVQMMEEIVPFMNGGLFECLDKPHSTLKGKLGGDIIIYNDGFSDRDDNLLVVPDYLFFDVDEDVDLSDDFGNKVYKNAKTRGLLEILQSYKFTITENTPIEEDVALDPELLGKVFENLLASYNPETKTTARKQTGSFYTPREIVNYMVDESLIAYLKSTVSFQLTATAPEASSFGISGPKASSFGIDQSKDALDTFFDPDSEIDIHNGNLPHWHQKDVWYFVTFRLADSIPSDKVEELKKDRETWKLKHKGKTKNDFSKDDWEEYHRLFSERVEGWMNAGYGAFILKDDENAKIVANALTYFQGSRYELDGWVVMPNHVHILVKPINEHTLPQICHSWKSFTANEINKRTGNKGQLWMHESYDHIVRNEHALNAIRNYIKQNPAKAGIVSKASSFNVPEASSFGISLPETSSIGIDVSGASSFGIDTAQSKDALDTMLHQLLSYDTINPFQDNVEIQKQIIKALDQCTILDPACGSGAFPMGILQKMVHVLHKIDPKNNEWEQRQIERVNKAIESLEEIDDIRFREQSIKELKAQIKDIEDSFENNELDYGRKLYLIENCIFGVDIQSIATQISKLRIFISLIVDQKIDNTKENFGIRPLPNLETKFVAANTLIGIEKPKAQLNLFENQEITKLDAELKKVRHKLFSAKIPATKRKLREQDKELRNQIADSLINDGWENQTACQLASWNPYDQNDSSPFFDPEWMFDIKNGFDVVIGNPPYGVSIKGNYRLNVEKYLGKVPDYEIYYYFIEVAYKLLKTNGLKSYIIPNTFLFNVFAAKYRKELLENWNIKCIADCTAFKIFDGATVYNAITLFEKDGTKFKVNIGYKFTNGASNFSDLIERKTSLISINELLENNQNWALVFKLDSSIIKITAKMRKNSVPLSAEFPEFSQGLIAYDLYQGQPKEIIEARAYHYNEKVYPHLKNWLWGEDVRRYIVEWNGKEWIDYCDGIANPRNPKFFIGKRLLIREITNPTIFCSITDLELYHDPALIVVLDSGKGIEFLCAILNSKLASFYHFNASPKATKGAFPKILVEDVKNFPLRLTSNKNSITNLVDLIYSAKKDNPEANTIDLEKQIDELVFKLYELTYEEVKVVTPDFWLSEAEYAAVEIQ